MATEPFIGELTLYASDRTPRGWLPADGRLISIMENNALFAIIGARFGGDGRSNFALPDMRKESPGIEGLVWCIAVEGVFPSS